MSDDQENKISADPTNTILRMASSEDNTPPEKRSKLVSTETEQQSAGPPPPLQPIGSNASNLLQNITNLIQSNKNINSTMPTTNAVSQLANALSASINQSFNGSDQNNSGLADLNIAQLLSRASPDVNLNGTSGSTMNLTSNPNVTSNLNLTNNLPMITTTSLPSLSNSNLTTAPIPNQPDISSTHYFNHDNILVVSLQGENVKAKKDYMKLLREAVATRITPVLIQEGYDAAKKLNPEVEPLVMRLNMRAETKRGIERANMCYTCYKESKTFKIFFKSQDGGSAITAHLKRHNPNYTSANKTHWGKQVANGKNMQNGVQGGNIQGGNIQGVNIQNSNMQNGNIQNGNMQNSNITNSLSNHSMLQNLQNLQNSQNMQNFSNFQGMQNSQNFQNIQNLQSLQNSMQSLQNNPASMLSLNLENHLLLKNNNSMSNSQQTSQSNSNSLNSSFNQIPSPHQNKIKTEFIDWTQKLLNQTETMQKMENSDNEHNNSSPNSISVNNSKNVENSQHAQNLQSSHLANMLNNFNSQNVNGSANMQSTHNSQITQNSSFLTALNSQNIHDLNLTQNSSKHFIDNSIASHLLSALSKASPKSSRKLSPVEDIVRKRKFVGE